MTGLSPAWLAKTALEIPGLALLLMILQYRPAEIRNLFRLSRAGFPQPRYIALAALRKYFIVSGLIVFVMNILVLLHSLTCLEQLQPGLVTAIIGICIALLFAYPICGIWTRRLKKIYRLPAFSFRVGFGNDRVTLYLAAAIGTILVLMITITTMTVIKIPLRYLTLPGFRYRAYFQAVKEGESGASTLVGPDTLYYKANYAPGGSTRTYDVTDGWITERVLGGCRERNKVVSYAYRKPNPSEWASFWRSMNALRLWEWKDSYTHPTDVLVLDGMHWEFLCRLGTKQMKSEGGNACPEPGEPGRTTDDGFAIDRLEEALDRLANPPLHE